ncbi:MAG: serine/threonine protein kinase [Verrucomicrobia subdivision 3 bacterium]|nr:serine/threonine protein kinase [Verrucomicrobiota bacterium]MCC6819806.1 serine/threonine protein kinase [Limisphaerales bacterium]
MADIWLATDGNGKSYALRRLLADLQGDATARKRFLQGCEALEKCQGHECVIGYLEHGKIEGQHYLAMEYVEGANLKVLYTRHDPVLLENVAQIIIDVASALEHIHECGYMHLDVKPENVLVSRNAAVRVVDFDLAQPITEKPRKVTKNPGTPAYMAPEQLSGQPIDQRVDVFAFGVAAYELLTNQKPFPGETSTEILRAQTDRSDFILPRQLNPDVPIGLERAILKCIEREPDKRYLYLSVLVRDLKAALYV